MENVLVTVEGIVEDVSIHVDSTTEVVHVNVETATASLVVIRRSAAEGAPVDGTTEATYLGQPCIVGDANGPFTVYTATQVSPSRWTAGTATSESIAAAIHAADAATPASADEWGFWQSVGGVLKKITHANFVTMVKAFLGTAAQATLGTGAGQVPVRGDYDPAGSAAVVSNAVVKPQMTVTGSLSPDATGYLYYAGVHDGYAHWTSDGVAYSGATANKKVLYHTGSDWVFLMYSAEVSTIYAARVSASTAATPDGLTFVPQTGTGDPTIAADGPLSSAQPAATPSIRALGTGATDAMPGNTAVAMRAQNLADLDNVVTARTNLKIVTLSPSAYAALVAANSADAATIYLTYE